MVSMAKMIKKTRTEISIQIPSVLNEEISFQQSLVLDKDQHFILELYCALREMNSPFMLLYVHDFIRFCEKEPDLFNELREVFL